MTMEHGTIFIPEDSAVVVVGLIWGELGWCCQVSSESYFISRCLLQLSPTCASPVVLVFTPICCQNLAPHVCPRQAVVAVHAGQYLTAQSLVSSGPGLSCTPCIALPVK